MAPTRIRSGTASNGGAAGDYIMAMIVELAALARRSGELVVAIHLEAIVAARLAAGGRYEE